jgi:predicted molibdopterin-dependent oxidoreductase YjgC
VAVDTFLNDSSKRADVVLAAAGYAETAGTTTNLEGRISLLHQRVTPPGVARADWIIAVELADRLGADLGLESPEDIWAEIEATSPAHAGITLELLRSPQGQDGVLAPMTPGAIARAQGTTVWINSHHPVLEAATEAGAPPANGREPLLAFEAPAGHSPPALDKYSLRLVATRKLYDGGTLVQHSPSLAGLAPGSTLRLNPADLDRLGRTSGERVKVSSARAKATAEAVADAGVPAGTAHLLFRQDGLNPAAFIDAARPVTDVRVETVK